MTIYSELKKKMKEKDLSIPKLAKQIGVSKQLLYYHLKKLKKGENALKLEQFKKISDVLEIDINFFCK
ncbi:MAG: helix-turn-helix transcriptional regulator [Pseudoleptotrichia goodfellowii]|nr:helix-turn-helix transcriptional regulator [Pseudoleptotrichia goodfellowii]